MAYEEPDEKDPFDPFTAANYDKIRDSIIALHDGSGFAPGAIGPESRGSGFKTGDLHPSGTGDIVITGVGFEPKFLRIIQKSPNGTTAYHMVGVTDGVASKVVGSITSGSTTAGWGGTSLIMTRSGGEAARITGTLVSFDEDGFTVNISAYSGTGGNQFWYEAYA